jgi:uroporphyrinogen decarboxylase
MTSREIVVRTLTFAGPERVAMTLPAPYPNDICGAITTSDPAHPEGGWVRVSDTREERLDEWGCTWARIEGFSKGEVARGSIEDWDQLDDFVAPDYDLPERYANGREWFTKHPGQFMMGHLPGFPFNVARKMRRMDKFLLDVAAEPQKVECLLAVVEEQMHHAMRRWAEAGAEGVMFGEDWGTQDRLLVSPATWRRMFKPGFERLCRTAHDCGLFVLMHSCGYIREAMDDMMEAGIDCFQFDQPALYGLERLAAEFSGRVTFWCPVDIQNTLQKHDAARIAAEARQMIDLFGAKDGGFIAGYYGGNEAIGLDPKWQDVACRAFVEHGAPQEWGALQHQAEQQAGGHN